MAELLISRLGTKLHGWFPSLVLIREKRKKGAGKEAEEREERRRERGEERRTKGRKIEENESESIIQTESLASQVDPEHNQSHTAVPRCVRSAWHLLRLSTER